MQVPSSRRFILARAILWLLVVIAAAGLLYLWIQNRQQRQTSPEEQVGLTLGGPFTLTDANGRPFSSASLAGKPYAIFFGFTHCPDVCPTTLARMVRLRTELDGNSDDLPILFVTVDPERDGPAEVGQYTALFNSTVIGLTGQPATIEQVKRQFGIFSQKTGDGENYGVDHTATVLLFDKEGQFVATIAQEESDQAALAKLRRLHA